MSRCSWCKGRVWPWQKSNRYGRYVLHLRCAKAMHQMSLRDQEITGV